MMPLSLTGCMTQGEEAYGVALLSTQPYWVAAHCIYWLKEHGGQRRSNTSARVIELLSYRTRDFRNQPYSETQGSRVQSFCLHTHSKLIPTPPNCCL